MFGTAARRRGSLLHIVRRLRRCCIEKQAALVYMVVASKIGIEATLVSTVSNLQKKGCVGVWSKLLRISGPMYVRAVATRMLIFSGGEVGHDEVFAADESAY